MVFRTGFYAPSILVHYSVKREVSSIRKKKLPPGPIQGGKFSYSESFAETKTRFILLSNRLRGNKTLWSQPVHFIRISAPMRITFQAFVPHG
jgi:hypothetical protein